MFVQKEHERISRRRDLFWLLKKEFRSTPFVVGCPEMDTCIVVFFSSSFGTWFLDCDLLLASLQDDSIEWALFALNVRHISSGCLCRVSRWCEPADFVSRRKGRILYGLLTMATATAITNSIFVAMLRPEPFGPEGARHPQLQDVLRQEQAVPLEVVTASDCGPVQPLVNFNHQTGRPDAHCVCVWTAILHLQLRDG